MPPPQSGAQSGETQPRPFVVAIDGPAASGKGTLARRLAERFGLAHLDTGRLYRATGFLVLAASGDARLLAEEVAAAASVVAAIPQVRAALLAFQREFAAHPPPPACGAILDG